jgi:hypothetical protein
MRRTYVRGPMGKGRRRGRCGVTCLSNVALQQFGEAPSRRTGSEGLDLTDGVVS